MLPVEEKRGLSYKQGEVELGVVLADAVVGARAEDQEVLETLGLRIAGVIPIGIKLVGLSVDFGISQCHVRRRHNHRTYTRTAVLESEKKRIKGLSPSFTRKSNRLGTKTEKI